MLEADKESSKTANNHSREKLSLPYFQLPKPELKNFVEGLQGKFTDAADASRNVGNHPKDFCETFQHVNNEGNFSSSEDDDFFHKLKTAMSSYLSGKYRWCESLPGKCFNFPHEGRTPRDLLLGVDENGFLLQDCKFMKQMKEISRLDSREEGVFLLRNIFQRILEPVCSFISLQSPNSLRFIRKLIAAIRKYAMQRGITCFACECAFCEEDDIIMLSDSEEQEPPVEKLKHKLLQQTELPSHSSTVNNDSIDRLDDFKKLDKDDKTPGARRLALKNHLMKKIHEKKVAAFNKYKEASRLEEEYPESDDCIEVVSGSCSPVNVQTEPDEDGGNEDSDKEDNKKEDSDDDICYRKRIKHKQLDDSDIEAEEMTAVNLSGTLSDDANGASEIGCSAVASHEQVSSENEESEEEDCNADAFSPNSTKILHETPEDEEASMDDEEHYSSDEEDNLPDCIPEYGSSDQKLNAGGFDHLKNDDNSHSSIDVNTFDGKSLVSHKEAEIPHLTNRDIPALGANLDNLPLTAYGQNMFSTQELENVCSGKFKNAESESSQIQETSSSEADNIAENQVKEFLDNEAELSGEDVGPDDENDDNDEMPDYIVADNEVPSGAEVRSIVNLHMRQMQDDDENRINEIKERIFENGDLNSETKRKLKFKWNDNDETEIEQPVSDSDSDAAPDENFSINEEKAKWKQQASENVEVDLPSSEKRSSLKIAISEANTKNEDVTKENSVKRGWYHMDDSTMPVLKRIRDDNSSSGRISTKHFVFKNEVDQDNHPRPAAYVLEPNSSIFDNLSE